MGSVTTAPDRAWAAAPAQAVGESTKHVLNVTGPRSDENAEDQELRNYARQVLRDPDARRVPAAIQRDSITHDVVQPGRPVPDDVKSATQHRLSIIAEVVLHR